MANRIPEHGRKLWTMVEKVPIWIVAPRATILAGHDKHFSHELRLICEEQLFFQG